MVLSEKELFLILTTNDNINKADIVVLLEGDGFERIKKACSLVLNGKAATLVFSGGIENKAYGSFPYEDCLPLILKTGIKEEQLIWESKSLHTRQQAEEIIKMCVERKWNKIILVASHYHQYRAFLTFLKILIEEKLDREFIIYNAPATQMPWFTPSDWGARVDLLSGEFERIEIYHEKGDIAGFKEANDYYKWRELQ